MIRGTDQPELRICPRCGKSWYLWTGREAELCPPCFIRDVYGEVSNEGNPSQGPEESDERPAPGS